MVVVGHSRMMWFGYPSKNESQSGRKEGRNREKGKRVSPLYYVVTTKENFGSLCGVVSE